MNEWMNEWMKMLLEIVFVYTKMMQQKQEYNHAHRKGVDGW